MAMASQSVEVLDKHLHTILKKPVTARERKAAIHTSKDFQQKLLPVLRTAWKLATKNDLRYGVVNVAAIVVRDSFYLIILSVVQYKE